jgi:creatinine amidohydrolase
MSEDTDEPGARAESEDTDGARPDVALKNLTWEEAGEAIAEADFAALPCGSIEQHSLHLPLSVDSIRAEELTHDLAERAPDHDLSVLTLPTLAYGYSEHHMNYPGTVTLTAETYQEVVIETADSMRRHGADRLLLVNCHGGNRSPLRLAADRIQRELDLPVYHVFWADFARDRIREIWGDRGGHAGAHETSAIELFRPDLVRQNRKAEQDRSDLPKTRQLRYFEDITDQGGLGDPRNADPDAMADLVEETNERILEELAADLATERGE